MKTYYDFHPMSIMSLGLGFSPADLSAAKPQAIMFKTNRLEGALLTTLDTILVRNSTQLKQALAIDLSVDASYLVFKGSASFQYNDSAVLTSDSITVILKLRTEYGRRTMTDAKLTDRAQRLIDDGKMSEFEQIYGSQYVVMERSGASVAVMLTILDVSNKNRSTINSSVAGSGGWGPLSASAKAALQSEISSADAATRLQIQVVATGGTGLGSLSELVQGITGQPNSLPQIQHALGEYIKQFTAENSIPIGFHVSTMKDWGWSGDNDIWTEEKERRLAILTGEYRERLHELERIQSILAGTDPMSSMIPPGDLQKMQVAIPAYNTALATIAKTHRDCKADPSALCDLPQVSLPAGLLPPLPPFPEVVWKLEVNGRMNNYEDSWKLISAGNYSYEDTVVSIWGTKITNIDLYFEGLLIAKFSSGKERGTIYLRYKDMPLLDLADKMFDRFVEAEGRFYLRVADGFGRNKRYDLLEAAWNHDNNHDPKHPGQLIITVWNRLRLDIPIGLTLQELKIKEMGLKKIIAENTIEQTALEPAFIIEVYREYASNVCTSGYLSVNGTIICYTLERPWVDNMQNISSIPAGTYPAFLRYDKADHWRIQLDDVPGRTGVQVHIGNEPDETQGCILVGMEVGPTLCTLSRSADAYRMLKRAFYDSDNPSSTPEKAITVKVTG